MNVERAFIVPALAALLAPVALFCDAHAEIADAQTLFTALALERFHPACAGLGESVNGDENLHRGLLRDSANVGFGLLGEDDPLHAASLPPRI